MTFSQRINKQFLLALSLFVLSFIAASSILAQNILQLPAQKGPGEPVIAKVSAKDKTDIANDDHPQIISPLEVIDDSVGFALPTFDFYVVDDDDNPIPVEWLNIVIFTLDDEMVLDKWYPFDLYCGDIHCTITLTLNDLPAGLRSGSYKWALRTWHPDTGLSDLSETESFIISMAAPDSPTSLGILTSTTPAQIYFTSDPLAAWYHIVIVDQEGGIAYDDWHSINELDCDSVPDWCIYVMTVNPDQGALVNGAYEMYVQAWGPGGLSDYTEAAPFTLEETVPDLPVFFR